VQRQVPPRHEADADGHGKTLSVNSPILFFAREREIVDEAWPGDIIGVPNHGVLRVGDTLTEGEIIKIVGIPNFAPEILRRVRLEDPMKSKQLKRALDDLAEEGVTQVFRRVIGGDNIVGVVGELQLDVLKDPRRGRVQRRHRPRARDRSRRRAGFSAESKATSRPSWRHRAACRRTATARPVFLARNAWELGYIAEKRLR
jgi:peptide chain release factor 3